MRCQIGTGASSFVKVFAQERRNGNGKGASDACASTSGAGDMCHNCHEQPFTARPHGGKAKNTAVRQVVMRCLRGALFVQQGRFLCLALSQTSG